MNSNNKDKQQLSIRPVHRSRDEARQFYNRISSFYDCLAGNFERKHALHALKSLNIETGENVLEIGFGTGEILKKIAQLVGKEGRVFGIDIAEKMSEVSRKKLTRVNLEERTYLFQGNAVYLPFNNNLFDAIFMSFTLELFDTPEIPKVLVEVKRVLKTGGRVGIVSLSKSYGNSMLLGLYEWLHSRWPKYLDCRPIYVADSLIEAGFHIKASEKVSLAGFPLEIIVSIKD
jgi:demethylmenaquinone methyltransferase/2-methoxy-6-polyprenyl-1,4-benzoquinol methylase